MARKKKKSRVMKPTYFVFCEGDTEKEYIKFLKSKYRTIAIDLKEKVEGNKISTRKVLALIEEKGLLLKGKDKIFLLYDIDAPRMLEKLKAIKDAILLTSNPTIEIWFLLHLKNQTAYITTENCLKELVKLWPNYKKGELTTSMLSDLETYQSVVIEKTTRSKEFSNPSSTVYKLINELENYQN